MSHDPSLPPIGRGKLAGALSTILCCDGGLYVAAAVLPPIPSAPAAAAQALAAPQAPVKGNKQHTQLYVCVHVSRYLISRYLVSCYLVSRYPFSRYLVSHYLVSRLCQLSTLS